MSTPVRLVGFLLGLLVVFIAGRGVGEVTSPVAAPGPAAEHGEHEEHDAAPDEVSRPPGGLQVSDQGYTLRVLTAPEVDRPVRFTIDGPDGQPVDDFDVLHDQPLHLVKIRRDGAGYEHVHPTMAPDGTWTAPLTLRPGSTRLFADFTPTGGPALVLGTDVEVAGAYEPRQPSPIRAVDRVDGYRVRLSGALVAGEASPLTATVRRHGRAVTDLEPYLGAYGHLVALREGDLAYLHVHPEESDAGPEIPFLAEIPSTGRYRLFLDFRHAGAVRTAAFTVEAFDEH